jgi:hypothetical protein
MATLQSFEVGVTILLLYSTTVFCTLLYYTILQDTTLILHYAILYCSINWQAHQHECVGCILQQVFEKYSSF